MTDLLINLYLLDANMAGMQDRRSRKHTRCGFTLRSTIMTRTRGFQRHKGALMVELEDTYFTKCWTMMSRGRNFLVP
jgi:hypothetical protein